MLNIIILTCNLIPTLGVYVKGNTKIIKMKLKLLFIAFVIATSALAQNNIYIDHGTYSTMKANHQLDITKNYLFTDALAPVGPPVKYHGPSNRSQSSICSCMIPLDSTFSVVPMYNYGGAYSAVYQDNRNDDASSIPLNIPFSFNFYGAIYNQLFINNNGNISFQQPYSQFTASMFPSPAYNMIAAFWGDVDTRDFSGNPSCQVYYKINPHSMIVKWENVGYYDMHFDKLNTFQMIISDGLDSILPAGKNVGYCYGDMQWTTGDASSGSGGFFGVPATVGVNQGNGADYFQVGTFAIPQANFDGPYNNVDGIDWLDNQGMYFNIATMGNIAPIIINNNICDTIDVYTGDTTRVMLMDTVQFAIGASTPEIYQTVNTTFYSPDTLAFSYDTLMNSPTYQKFMCTFIATNLPAGLHYIYVTATDNGSPAMSTIDTIVIRSDYYPGVTTGINTIHAENSKFEVAPNPSEEFINVKHTFGTSAILNITNVIGQSVINIQLTNQEQKIDISSLNKGIYFATITSKEGKSKTIKVVKK